MLQYIEDANDITRSHKKLQATIRRSFSKTAVKDIGHPGGRERKAVVATDGRCWFWTTDHRGSDVVTKRRLNWFGVLGERPGVSITVEVNTTYRDRDDRSAGFFARDPRTRAVYFLHSGRVGGGAKGVGKNSFLTWAAREKRDLVEVIDSSGRIREGLVVMPVEGRGAAKSAVRYIDLVREFKKAVRSGEIASRDFQKQQRKFEDYFSEGRGRRRGKRNSEIDYISRHGEIVDALRDWRAARSALPRRLRIVKDVFIDLGVASGNKLVEIFEVKPQVDRSSVYSAIGQLLVHGRGNPPGKEASMGDAVNWVCLLKEVPVEEDINVVSGDKDFRSQLSELDIHEYLDKEWSDKKNSTVWFYSKISDYFKDDFPDIKIASELEKDLLIQNLLNSGSFAATHGYIAKLSKQQEFSLAQVEQLVEIPESNNQVGWIVDDGDVHSFYKSLLCNYGDKVQTDITTKLAQLVAKGEPVVDEVKNA